MASGEHKANSKHSKTHKQCNALGELLGWMEATEVAGTLLAVVSRRIQGLAGLASFLRAHWGLGCLEWPGWSLLFYLDETWDLAL